MGALPGTGDDGVLAPRAQPQVTVVHQEVGAVVLGRDRELGARLGQDLHAAHGDLVDARLLGVLLDLAAQRDARLLLEVADRLEGLRAGLGASR